MMTLPTHPLPVPRRAALLSLLSPLLLPGMASAHGPTRQKVVEQISINSPAAAVWARIRNFDALKAWHPAVAESPADKGNDQGSVRQLKLQGGGALTEVLESHDDSRMRYTYRAKDGGALPVTNYTSAISVKPDGDAKCTVEWRGAFYRAHPNNDPPPEQNDEAAVKAVTGVYQAGLAHLKKLAEAR